MDVRRGCSDQVHGV